MMTTQGIEFILESPQRVFQLIVNKIRNGEDCVISATNR
jgi:hypothetical protein